MNEASPPEGEATQSAGPAQDPSLVTGGSGVIAASVLIVVLVAAVAFVWWFAIRSSAVEIPAVELEGADPAVAAAISAARAAVDEQPTLAAAWGKLGMVLQAHDHAWAAETCFAQAEILDPNDARWPYLRGVGLSATDPSSAIELFQRAAALPQGRPWAKLRLADLLIDAGRVKEAETHLTAVLDRDPQNARAMLGIARSQLRQGQTTAARKWVEQSVENAPTKRSPRELLAQICFRQGDLAAAEIASATLEHLPDEETTWKDPFVEAVLALNRGHSVTVSRAQELIQQGQAQQGIALLEKLAADHPSAEHSQELGEALVRVGDLARASELLDRVLVTYSDAPELTRLGGTVAFLQGRWQQAADLFRRTTELKPDDAIAYYNLGHSLRKLGDDVAASTAFRSAVASKPEFANAHINLGKLLIEMGRPEEARRHVTAATSLAPDDPVARSLQQQLAGRKEESDPP